MVMSNVLVNKNSYKVFLGVVKYIPTLLAIIKVITLCCNYFKIPAFALTCIGGTSIITLGILYLVSHIFKFCGTHRISLHYTTLIYALTLIDYYIGIPLSTAWLYRLYTIITGVFMTSWIVVWYKNRKNPEIDHIKQLCDTYSDCGC